MMSTLPNMAILIMVAQVAPHTTAQPADLNVVTTCHASLLHHYRDTGNAMHANEINTAQHGLSTVIMVAQVPPPTIPQPADLNDVMGIVYVHTSCR